MSARASLAAVVVVGTLFANSVSFASVSQLNLVDNLLVSANHQLTLFLVPPNPIIPPNPITPWGQNALNFYLDANAVLDAIPPNPILPPNDVNILAAIIGQAHNTLDLLAFAPPDPIIPLIVNQANLTIELATDLQSCTPGGDVCSTP